MKYRIYTGVSESGNIQQSVAIRKEKVDAEGEDFNPEDYISPNFHRNVRESGVVIIEGTAEHCFPDWFAIGN